VLCPVDTVLAPCPQLHVWLQANAKELIVYIPGYPLMNFVFATVIYVYISYVLFHLTNAFSAFLLPNDMKQIALYWTTMAIVGASSVALAFIVRPILF
jgi:hypothetical protein